MTVTQLPSLFSGLVSQIKQSVLRLVLETGIRAEFQSALGLLLVAIWFLFVGHPGPSPYVEAVNHFIPLSVFATILLSFSFLQTVSNIWKIVPRLRLVSAFLSWAAWTTLCLIGVFVSFNYLAVPLTASFAVAQALVFIHLEKVSP